MSHVLYAKIKCGVCVCVGGGDVNPGVNKYCLFVCLFNMVGP